MRGTTRRAFARVHRYLGLSLLGFLLVIACSGFMLVFQYEWDAMINPALYRVEAPGAPSLPPARLEERIAEQLPGVHITHLPLVERPVRASVVYVGGRDDFDEAFVDPTTGQVNGVRLWGECCDRANALPLLYKVHNRLLMPTGIGRRVMAAVAVTWLVLSAIGLLIALSAGRRSLTWRRGLAGRTAYLQLHRHLGIWSFPLVLLTVVTGLSIALEEEVTQPLASAFVGDGQPAWTAAANNTTGEHRGIGAVLDSAVGEVAGDIRFGDPVAVDYSPGRGQYRIAFADQGLPRGAPHFVHVDAGSARVLGTRIASRAPHRLLDNRITLHSGELLGLPGKLIAAGTALGLAVMAVTALLMWFGKSRGRQSGGSGRG